MPPPRQAIRRRGRNPIVSARSARRTNSEGWLSVRLRQFKREGRRGAEPGDDGLPFGDETLIEIFSGLLDAGDLARCAATCRRWRRLVSANAAHICRREPPRFDRFVRRLALGFFFRRTGGADGLLDSSRVVACRNGRVVLDLRRTKSPGCIMRLCVCNPMTGDLDVLPPLRGKDAPGPYACTVLTADDRLNLYDAPHGPAASSSSYRVLLVYKRRSSGFFTVLRCYSSETASWGPEAEVSGATIRRNRQLGVKLHATIVRGGDVCWPELTLALTPSTFGPAAKGSATASRLPWTVRGFHAPVRAETKSNVHRLSGVMPDGRMCVVEADGGTRTIQAYCVGPPGVGSSGRKERLWALKVALLGMHAVKLRWFCEKSGVVLFTARRGSDAGPTTCVYAVDVRTRQLDVVAAGGEAWEEGEICGYEMDRVALLACC